MVHFPVFLTSFLSSYVFSQSPYQLVLEDAPVHKSVAIVGAGSAGLAMLQTLVTLPESLREGWEFSLFDERREVGGVWFAIHFCCLSEFDV